MSEQMVQQIDTVWIPRWLLVRTANCAMSEFHGSELRDYLMNAPMEDSIEVPVLVVKAWVSDLSCQPYTHKVWYTLRSFIETEPPELKEKTA